MARIMIDVMVNNGETFYTTIAYEFNPLFRFDMKACEEYVFKKCPTLKYEKGVQLWLDEKA